MIYKETEVKIVDNSGGAIGICISPPKDKKFGQLGDIIMVAVKSTMDNIVTSKKGTKVSKGDIKKALIVGTVKKITRSNGDSFEFTTNNVILLADNEQPLGTRIFAPLPYELRKFGRLKALSLATHII